MEKSTLYPYHWKVSEPSQTWLWYISILIWYYRYKTNTFINLWCLTLILNTVFYGTKKLWLLWTKETTCLQHGTGMLQTCTLNLIVWHSVHYVQMTRSSSIHCINKQISGSMLTENKGILQPLPGWIYFREHKIYICIFHLIPTQKSCRYLKAFPTWDKGLFILQG